MRRLMGAICQTQNHQKADFGRATGLDGADHDTIPAYSVSIFPLFAELRLPKFEKRSEVRMAGEETKIRGRGGNTSFSSPTKRL
jgi:hypothetical protein